MINSINFLNFKQQTQTTKQNAKNPFLNFNITAPKLAPLAFDTISFTSNNKASLNKSLYDAFDNGDMYLLSPAYENDGKSKPNLNDIILFDGSSTYYVAKVKVIDAAIEDFSQKALLAEMLLDSVSEQAVYEHYFKEVDLDVFDKQVRDYFVTKYGEY